MDHNRRHFTRGALRLALGVIAANAGLSCGGSSSGAPPSSPPTSPTPPAVSVANVAGNWTGTLESSNGTPLTLSMVVVQFADCVDGSWKSADGDWSGAISGFARPDAFSGQITFERRSNGGCVASGNIGGDVGSDTLRWISVGATPLGVCPGTLPQSITLTMRRQ